MHPFFFKAKTLCAVSLLSAILISACSEQQATAPQGLPVDIYQVKAIDVPVVSRLTGRANSTRKAEVRPQVSGIIQKRLFVEGSYVEQGEQLFQIDTALYEASVTSAKANLQSAKATEHAAKLKSDRYRELLKRNAVSKQEYDDANAVYLQAAAAVQAAAAQLETAQINLAYTKVYAPISGQIGKSDYTEGALVSAQQASPLATIQQLDPMYVDLGQSVNDHIALKQAVAAGKFKLTGDKPVVDILFSTGEKYSYSGTLEFADVTVDPSTGMVNLRAVVPNPEHIILPGMFLRGDIAEGMLKDAIVVPQDAITREAGGNSFVYIIDEKNMAQRQNIKLGVNYENYYVVTEGLNVGDKIITSNLQKVRSNTPVIDAKMLEQQTMPKEQ